MGQMTTGAWYALRVDEGAEAPVRALLQAAMREAGVAGECINPQCLLADPKDYESSSLHDLLPGCVVVRTDDIQQLTYALKRSSALRRASGRRVAFAPLPQDVAQWLESCTHTDCTFGMSEGYDEHGKVTVTKGPLLGREAMIRKANHRKKLAYIRIPLFGDVVEAQMGLRLVRK